VYLRVGSALLTSVDNNLRAQIEEMSGHVEHGTTLVDRDAAGTLAVGQVVSRDGRVLRSTPAHVAPLLDRERLKRVLGGRRVGWNTAIEGLRGQWRLLAAPVRSGHSVEAVVAAASLTARDETLDRLARELLLGATLALLLAIVGGYLVAAAALRPVEAMRARAAAITASTRGHRLPVPDSRDELARLAATLNDMLARLEAAFEHERRFLADASHELRTPLALLRTELELALRRPRSRDELEEALRSAADETERLTRLAEDLLLIARFDRGSLPIRPERLSARELLDDVAERFGARAAQAGRELTVEAGVDAFLDADPVRLGQALGNLVDNALTYGRGRVRLFVISQPEQVELHVSDEGPGFSAEFVGRAFDRFSRADDARSPGGTGLGLAIVELIASAHGGTATVANRPGGGADAWLALAPATGFVPAAVRT
jgi:signal transduction histidine kinase